MSEPSSSRRPQDLLWQGGWSHRSGAFQHAFWHGEEIALCRQGLFDPKRPINVVPVVEVVCQACTRVLLADHSKEFLLELPLATLGSVLSTRAFRIIQRMVKQENPLVAVLQGINVEHFMSMQGSGLKCLACLTEAMSNLGMELPLPKSPELPIPQQVPESKLPISPKPKDGLKRLKSADFYLGNPKKRGRVAGQFSIKTESLKRRALEAQVVRFTEAFSPEELQSLYLQEMGDRLGLSRERVRQIFEGNPVLALLRGPDAEARRVEKQGEIGRRLLTGEPIGKVLSALRVSMSNFRVWEANDPNFKIVTDMARKIRKEQQQKCNDDQIRSIAAYARDHQVSFRAACEALKLDYQYMIHIKNHHSTLKADPTLRDVLDPSAVIDDQIAIIRERILTQGMTLAQASKGLQATANTVYRRLAEDKEVQEALGPRRKNPRIDPELLKENLRIVRERILAGGTSIAAACKGQPLREATVRRYLMKDPAIRAALGKQEVD